MARTGRAYPARAVITKPWPSTSIGSKALAMSLVLSSSGGSIIPPFAPRAHVYPQAVNRSYSFHHLTRRTEWLTWPPRPPMPPSMR